MNISKIKTTCIAIDSYLINFCAYLSTNNFEEYTIADELEDFLGFYNRHNDYYIHLKSHGKRHDLLIRFKDSYLAINFIFKKGSRNNWDYTYNYITITNLDGEIIEEW